MKTLQIIMLLSIVFIGNGCKKSKQTLTIGQSYQGGIIAYIDQTGQHGLIAANQDLPQGMMSWGCDFTSQVIGTETIYGSGANNTQKMVNNCQEATGAGRRCYDLVSDGYSDWFLPSFDELKLLFSNLKLTSKATFQNTVYASSSEATCANCGPEGNIYRLDFAQGYDSNTPKRGTYYVRPCRYF